MREVTAPTVSTPWEGKRTSSTSKTNAKAIKARPTQLGESEPAAKKKSNSAMPPVTPGKITPGCEISTYRHQSDDKQEKGDIRIVYKGRHHDTPSLGDTTRSGVYQLPTRS